MDRDGVDAAVVMGIGWTDEGLARDVNDYIVESVGWPGDRISGLAGEVHGPSARRGLANRVDGYLGVKRVPEVGSGGDARSDAPIERIDQASRGRHRAVGGIEVPLVDGRRDGRERLRLRAGQGRSPRR